MRKLILHAADFSECWAHYYFHTDPDFLGRLRGLGWELVLSRDAGAEADGSPVVFLEASSAGAGRETTWRKLERKIATRCRRPGIPPADRWDPASHRRPFALHGPGHRSFFAARGRPRVLLALEGVMHAPDNYNPEARRHFDRILTWNDALLEPGRTIKYCVPQPVRWPAVDQPPFERRKWLVNISANKRVKHPLELYTERRRALARYAREIPEQFDLYGMWWERTRFARSPCYRGEAKGKAEVFSRYRFGLIYENAQVPGYVTEKLFDAMRSGCVPVYLGAPNVAQYVPKECFVDRRDFRSDHDLAEFLGSVTEREHERYRAAIREYLDGPGFRPFLVTSFAEAMAEALR